ncbi:hypothetical protein Tco_1220271 [Tanacetum coccineum]
MSSKRNSRESHSGSMSSMKNLDDTYNFGDQFLYDKPTEDDQEKSKVIEESDSTYLIQLSSGKGLEQEMSDGIPNLIEKIYSARPGQSPTRNQESEIVQKAIIRIQREQDKMPWDRKLQSEDQTRGRSQREEGTRICASRGLLTIMKALKKARENEQETTWNWRAQMKGLVGEAVVVSDILTRDDNAGVDNEETKPDRINISKSELGKILWKLEVEIHGHCSLLNTKFLHRFLYDTSSSIFSSPLTCISSLCQDSFISTLHHLTSALQQAVQFLEWSSQGSFQSSHHNGQEMSVENVSSGLVPQGQKASDYDNSDPVPPRQNVVPTAEKTDSSQQGLEFLFSPLLEEYYNPTHGQAEENNNNQAPNASFQEDEFINPFCTRVQGNWEEGIDFEESFALVVVGSRRGLRCSAGQGSVIQDHPEKSVYLLRISCCWIKASSIRAWYDELSNFMMAKDLEMSLMGELEIEILFRDFDHQSQQGLFINQATFSDADHAGCLDTREKALLARDTDSLVINLYVVFKESKLHSCNVFSKIEASTWLSIASVSCNGDGTRA